MASDPVVAQLKPDQVQEITTAFMEFDGNRNGFITPSEMKECLRRSNIQFQDAEVDRVMANMDLNHDGSVSYDEYMKFMARVYTGQFDQFQRTPPVAPYQQSPFNPSQLPYNQSQPPYNQSQPPYNQNQPPYQHNQPPYQQNQPPYNQSQPPYNQSQPPYNQNQPPYNPNPSNYPPQGQYNQPPSNYPPRNY